MHVNVCILFKIKLYKNSMKRIWTSISMVVIKVLKMKVTQSCLTLCDPVDYTVHGILQARIQGWVAVPFSRGSSQPRDGIHLSSVLA